MEALMYKQCNLKNMFYTRKESRIFSVDHMHAVNKQLI